MKYERKLRWVRSHPALYGDCGPKKEEQAMRLITKLKKKLAPVFKARAEHAEWLRGQRLLSSWH